MSTNSPFSYLGDNPNLYTTQIYNTIHPQLYITDISHCRLYFAHIMSGGFQRALPLALTVFCGVVGGQ
ncbi:hypothetical protein H0G86_007814 [Trichoderma simmonsii]|uniref:Uncharacterized protein n=1 Tax=Trichoderma simmonsii TaxID=1491479 RepID=A0A8G0LH96_9HYPO|nr:hypothetical protein H0G86_007814 [Trichoderma simmonsii]